MSSNSCGGNGRWLRQRLLLRDLFLGMIALLGAVASVADPSPRLGTLMRIEEDALIVKLNNEPQGELQRIPLSREVPNMGWQPGMQVRVWPGAGPSAIARVTPVGTKGHAADLTGVRRRLNRGRQGGQRTPGGGGGSGGRGHGGR